MADSDSDPKTISSLLHPLLLQPHGNAVLDRLERQLERADRAQADELAAGIARRIIAQEASQRAASNGREKRRTRVELRPLAWPVWFGERVCTVAVTEKFIAAHPREHVAVTHWFADLAAAQAEFPEAKLLDDAPAVAPRLGARA